MTLIFSSRLQSLSGTEQRLRIWGHAHNAGREGVRYPSTSDVYMVQREHKG